MSETFEGKSALVTGGGRGIGFAVAQRLLDLGARVAITGRSEQGLAEAASRFTGGDRLLTVLADATDLSAAHSAVQTVIADFGSLNLLVNNAALGSVTGPLMDLEFEPATHLLAINTLSPLAYVQHAWRGWMQMRGGAVVNIASIAGLTSSPALPWYGVSKAALINLTTQLSMELAPRVRVNAVAPGVIKTDFSRLLYEGREAQAAAAYPLHRLGTVQDVAAAVTFLLSDEASWITGETLVLDGGLLKKRPAVTGE